MRDSRGKPVISTHKALREVREAMGERNEYAALQTSWADWCARHLDRTIVRGTRRTTAQDRTLSPDPRDAAPADKTTQSAGAPPEGLWAAIRDASLSQDQTEALSGLLRLGTEIARHRAAGADYTPPAGALTLSAVPCEPGTDPWPFIEAIRSGALGITETAHRLGMGLSHNAGDRYEAGRAHFPDLSDRMHLAAVVARCPTTPASR